MCLCSHTVCAEKCKCRADLLSGSRLSSLGRRLWVCAVSLPLNVIIHCATFLEIGPLCKKRQFSSVQSDVHIVPCKHTRNQSTAPGAFIFFGLQRKAFWLSSKKSRFFSPLLLRTVAAQFQAGRWRQISAPEVLFIYHLFIQSLQVANISRAAREHVVEFLRCNVRYRPWLRFASMIFFLVRQQMVLYIHVRYLTTVDIMSKFVSMCVRDDQMGWLLFDCIWQLPMTEVLMTFRVLLWCIRVMLFSDITMRLDHSHPSWYYC